MPTFLSKLFLKSEEVISIFWEYICINTVVNFTNRPPSYKLSWVQSLSLS